MCWQSSYGTLAVELEMLRRYKTGYDDLGKGFDSILLKFEEYVFIYLHLLAFDKPCSQGRDKISSRKVSELVRNDCYSVVTVND